MIEQDYKNQYISEHKWSYLLWRFYRLNFTKKLHTKEAYIQEHYYDYLLWKLDKIVVDFGNMFAGAVQIAIKNVNDRIREVGNGQN